MAKVHKVKIPEYEGYYLQIEKNNMAIMSEKSGLELRPLSNYCDIYYRLYTNGVPEDVPLFRLMALASIELAKTLPKRWRGFHYSERGGEISP